MSDKRQEAISDIIAEMRLGATGDMPFAYRIGRPDRIVKHKTKDGKKYVQRRAVIESVTIDELADRLDAAHKREVEKLNLVIQATVSRSDAEIDRLRREVVEASSRAATSAVNLTNEALFSNTPENENSGAVNVTARKQETPGNAAKLREVCMQMLELLMPEGYENCDVSIELDEDQVVKWRNRFRNALAEPARNCDWCPTWEAAKAAYWREQGDPADWRKLGAWLFAAKEEVRGEGSPRTEQESEVK